MQNDERDPRDTPPESPGAEAAEEPTEEPTEEAATEPADGAEDEFETASWPSQDAAAPPGPDESEAFQPEPPTPGPEPEPEPELEPGPPPPDVEAYASPAPPSAPAVEAHSVPATEPGESTLCPRCGTENRPGIAFCRNCGQRLVAAGAPVTVERPEPPEGTQACPRCGTHNRAGVAFCQNCGANLRAAAVGAHIDDRPVQAAAGRAERGAGAGRAILGPVVLLIGLVVALVWAIGLAVLFVVVELFGGPGGTLIDILRALSPAGIIFLLAALIVVIGALTRVGRG